MVRTARVCIFCGQRAGSGEHGFPDWLNGVFPAQEVGPPSAVEVKVGVHPEHQVRRCRQLDGRGG